MNDSEPYFNFSASFRIKNAKDMHDLITRKTGIIPTHCHCVGDIANSKTGRKWLNDIWSLESQCNDTENLSKHISNLWETIEPHKEFFKGLVEKGVDIDVFCGYSSDCDHAGFSIEPQAFEIFTYLNIILEMSVIVA